MTREAAVKTDAGALRALADAIDGWRLPAQTLPRVASQTLRTIAEEREAATNTRAGLREAVAHVWVEHFAKARDTHMPAAKGAEAEWQLIQFLGCYLRLASNEPVQSAVDAARARADEDQDRLRSALYRILERYGAESDVLALVGSLWDTLETPEVVGLMEDWLRDGETMRSPQ